MPSSGPVSPFRFIVAPLLRPFLFISSLLIPCPVWASEPAEVDFQRDVAPLLETHCVRCHSPTNRKGELSLATANDLREWGYLDTRSPADSHLLSMVTSMNGQPPAMPKEGVPLTAQEVETLRQWITQGAHWPEGVEIRQRSKADGSWWSLQPLAKVAPPEMTEGPVVWRSHPIDRFLFDQLEQEGLNPNPPADRVSLLRRVTYDLTGLPPTPEEVTAFLADESSTAYETVVDRLLASPRYGERWGRHWLDVIRFGESRGYERNEIIKSLWPFRDYVIHSLNQDKPFDVMVREHLAGDLIGRDQPEVEVGVAYLVSGPYDDVGNQDAVQAAQIRANTIDEMIRTTSEAFLGLTIGCARCHDHKFDPILQSDYYGLYATFAGVHHGERSVSTAVARQEYEARRQPLATRRQELTATGQPTAPEAVAKLAAIDQQLAAIPPLPRWWVGNMHAAPGPFSIFLGGDPQRPGPPVIAHGLQSLSVALAPYEAADSVPENERRLRLAEWLIDSKNPLTARVLANRLWHYHFGTGLVETPSDFGYMGSRPSHPELLDWLAGQVHEHGWRWKPLHKLIVLSQAYQQSTAPQEAGLAKDAQSRWLWRFPPRRLSAEEVRDTFLAVSGKLDLRMGGPGFKLYTYLQDNVATYVPLDVHGPDTYRRAIYHHNARASRIDLITDFDSPDCAFSTPRRASTTTPLQALTLLNHQFTRDMADALAARALADSQNDATRALQRVFLYCYSRLPTSDEEASCKPLVQRHGLRAVCRALLNSSELLYLN